MPKATIKTIALEAGVSIATVSKALNDMPDVSNAVKARVREIAKRQGYVQNVAARQLVSGHTSSVGVILPSLAGKDAARFYLTLAQRLQRAGYVPLLGASEGDVKAEAALAADMRAKGAELLLVYPVSTGKRHIEEAAAGLPLVYAGGAVNPAAGAAVVCDEYRGGMLAAAALCEGGCKTAAVFTWGGAATAQYERARGFLAYMQEHGVPARVYKSSDYLTENTGRAMARELMETGKPGGVFATDDLIAAGAMSAFQDAGLYIPEDVQLVGYGDAVFAGLSLVELTSVALPSHEMGICAADLALGLLGRSGELVRRMTLEPQLIRRGSTSGRGKS